MSNIACVLQCGGIWIGGKGWGLTWKMVQGVVKPREIVSVYGRTLDIYLNGKLVRTCLMPNVAKIDPASSLYVTPKGGFSGWTSKFQYWPYPCDPQTAWNTYSAGYGGSAIGNMFSYGVKVAVVQGNNETSSFTI
jgi:hypothetical protein